MNIIARRRRAITIRKRIKLRNWISSRRHRPKRRSISRTAISRCRPAVQQIWRRCRCPVLKARIQLKVRTVANLSSCQHKSQLFIFFSQGSFIGWALWWPSTWHQTHITIRHQLECITCGTDLLTWVPKSRLIIRPNKTNLNQSTSAWGQGRVDVCSPFVLKDEQDEYGLKLRRRAREWRLFDLQCLLQFDSTWNLKCLSIGFYKGFEIFQLRSREINKSTLVKSKFPNAFLATEGKASLLTSSFLSRRKLGLKE